MPAVYTTITLKLEDGTIFEIPQAVSTTIQSYVITIYQNHCYNKSSAT